MVAVMSSNRSSRAKVEETSASVNSEAMRLLHTNPDEFFRKTHKPVPFGFTAPSEAPESD